MARRYLISNIEKTTNLKNAAVAKALNNDSTNMLSNFNFYVII
jgi:hypothetical protein